MLGHTDVGYTKFVYVLRLNAKTPLPLSHPRWPCIAGHREESSAIAKNLQRVLSDACLTEQAVEDKVLVYPELLHPTREGVHCSHDTYIINMLFIHRLIQFLFWSGVLLMYQSKAVRVLYPVHDVDLPHSSSWSGLIEGCLTCGAASEGNYMCIQSRLVRVSAYIIRFWHPFDSSSYEM